MTLIEKLNKEREKHHDLQLHAQTLQDSAYYGGVVAGITGSIGMVEGHKCTWRGTLSKAEETIYYTLSCGNKYVDNCLGVDVECFKYCPFCGGEIQHQSEV